ncbi:hypothetical protein TrCOL_g13201 [Triparma columacea]|uniref:tRNA-binding domain-containing protein n=1 Tax=Triparma columacea TaxID=722753 RepID=A0A9W7FYQ0_9STRA|nr:hypothetical protein TrCOL_g13201 [Triparma columacea]
MYTNYAIATCITIEDMKSPLRLTTMDIGSSSHLSIVTNSSLVRSGSKYIIAMSGAIVPAGSSAEDDGVIVVKTTTVGGRKSEGIICDAPMLGWGSTNSGVPVFLTGSEYVNGDTPPSSKPGRGVVGGGGEVREDMKVETEPLFEKKMTKEEKKAAAKAKREAKRAAKEAGK